MPKGVVSWFDERSGEGRIRRDGREYPVSAGDIEREARVPMARVDFDVRRLEGVKQAVNVTLHRGRRMSPRQHRFGDLAGAHHPDEKGHHPLTDDRPGTDWAFEGHPVELILEWGRLVNLDDLSTLRLLYAPEAVLHVGSEDVLGRDAVVDRMREDFSGPRPQMGAAHERDGVIRVELKVGAGMLEVDFKVSHGRVVEQWM
jgi:hypothetical protein